MKFRKIRNIVFASVLSLSVTACASGSSDGSTNSEPAADTNTEAQADTSTETEEVAEESTDTGATKLMIGGIGPLTGPAAQYGIEAFNGVKLALKEADFEYEFIEYDDMAEPQEAVGHYSRLVNQDNVDVILGAVTSGSTLAFAPTAVSDNMPVLTPTGTNDSITTLGDNVFRACFNDSFQGEVMAKFAYETLGLNSAGVIYNNSSDYSMGLAEAFKTTFESLGGTVSAYESYSEADSDFKTQLGKINGNVETLFIPDYYSKVALITEQAFDLGMDVPLLGADGWAEVLSLDLQETEHLNNSYIVNTFSAQDDTPAVQEFVTKYTEEYGTAPSGFAASGYDAGQILIDAYNRAGTNDKQALIDAISSTDINSVGGNITFNETGDPHKAAVIEKFVDGQMELVDKFE